MHPHQYQDEESPEPKVHDVQIVGEESDAPEPSLSDDARRRIRDAAEARWGKQAREQATNQAVVQASPIGEIQLTGTATGVRRWVDAAEKFGRCAVACQVMAGFELLELKKALGFTQGRKNAEKKNRNDCGFSTWEEYVRSECGLSDRTAFNWMRMAEFAKPRLKKLSGIGSLIRDILTKPVAELSPTESQLLSDAVHKLTDGRTQLDFMVELGLAKAPQGSAANGGNLGHGQPSTPTDEDMRRIVRESWTHIAERLSLEKESFTLLDDAQVDALIDYTDRLTKAMRTWLSTPKAKRGPEAVSKARELLQ